MTKKLINYEDSKSSKLEHIKVLKRYRKYFGYAYPVESHHTEWYNRKIDSVVKSLNRECSQLCMPWDTACRELIGLAVHKLILSGIKECIEVGVKFAVKYMGVYYKNHNSNRKLTFRLLEDMSYVADTLEKYKDKIDNVILK